MASGEWEIMFDFGHVLSLNTLYFEARMHYIFIIKYGSCYTTHQIHKHKSM